MSPPVVDGAFARWLATRAGQALAEVRAELGTDDPGELLGGAGKAARDLLLTELARWRPADAVLAAETHGAARHPDRLQADRVWIVDPLDGAADFTEAGGTGWAVHVALWSRSAGLAVGAVALPALHRVIGTDHPPAYPPLTPSAATGGPLRIGVGLGAPAAALDRLAARVRADFLPAGCVGGRIAAVIAGQVDAYVQLGNEYEWRTAGPVAVATATGLYASRIDGSALAYNRSDPCQPDLLVCRKDLAARLLAALRDVVPA